MNDFFLASNRPLKLNIGDFELDVRQITMKDLDIWLIATSEIKETLGNSKIYSDEMLTRLIAQYEIQCYSMINLVTDLDIDSIIKTKINNPYIFMELVRKTLEANQAVFVDTIKKQRKENSKNESNSHSWFDSFQLLISTGHSHESIMNMSFGAYKHYLDAAIKACKHSIATQASLLRMAQHSTAREFKKYIDEIKFD